MLNITIIEIASNIISKIKCEEIYFNRDKDYNEVISFLTWDLDEGVSYTVDTNKKRKF